MCHKKKKKKNVFEKRIEKRIEKKFNQYGREKCKLKWMSVR